MNWPKDIHNKRARVGTAIFMTLVLIFIFFFGLTYINPPPNNGPVINFGFDEQGAGETASSERVEEVVEQTTPVTPPPTETTPVVTDDVTTQDVVDAVAVDKKEEPKPKVVEPKKTEEPVKEEPKPSNDLMDRLNKTKNQKEASEQNGNKSGEGETKGGGDQGKVTGGRNSDSREGQGGPGDGDYFMNGRSAKNKPKPVNDCLDQNGKRYTGRVVIKVYVDRDGKVFRAEDDIKAPDGRKSTASSDCLFKKAKKVAMKTTWSAKHDADDTQIGWIVYNFQTK